MADLARLVARLRSRGVAETLRKAFADKVYRRSSSVIVEYRIGWGTTARGDVRPDWLTFAAVRDPHALPPLGDWLAWRAPEFRAMLAEGKVALFALRHGVVVGCVWVALSDHRDAAAREFYAVGPNEAYHYCWLVDPALRRTNLGIPLCRFVMTELAAMGIVRQFGVVDRVNRASYVIQMRYGYREAGTEVIHTCILGQRFTRMRRYTGTLGLLPAAQKAS